MSSPSGPAETPKPTEPAVAEASGETCVPETVQPSQSDEDLQRCLDEAVELKVEGNDEFRAQQWNGALALYRRALGRLPKRRTLKNTKRPEPDADSALNEEEVKEGLPEQTPSTKPNLSSQDDDDLFVPSALEQQCIKARAVLNANIAACHVKLSGHKEAVAACTEALLDDPDYVKALQRRAASNEQLDTWSSLTSAQEDYKKLIDILPSSSRESVEARRHLQALTPRVEAAQKRETGEMIDKLKGLGNSILGNFGLSTDNFQFVPNGQGGYSMNFVR